MEAATLKGGWSFVLVESGPPYAAMDGTRGKPMWCAGSWDILEMVCLGTHDRTYVVCLLFMYAHKST